MKKVFFCGCRDSGGGEHGGRDGRMQQRTFGL